MDKVVKSSFSQVRPAWVWLAVTAVLIAGATLFWEKWLPPVQDRIMSLIGPAASDDTGDAESQADAPESGHAPEHGSHDDSNTLELSSQARGNIGLQTGPVEIRQYDRTISVPGIVVERPGQSVVNVTAPMTGVVTQLNVTIGQAVTTGQKLFDLRLTHEDIVQAQSEFLRMAQELDVIRKEVARLERVTQSGAVAGKSLLEREYEQAKVEATFAAQREALLLHGLSEDQVEQILETRRLLRSISVYAPAVTEESPATATVWQVQTLAVERGQHVSTGDSLAVLANHTELLIEGRAFQKDAPAISRALEKGWPLTAILESPDGEPMVVEKLPILFVSSRVDTESRAMHFYVQLPNKLVSDSVTDGRRYVAWRFKPGQRMQVRVPVEKWEDRIVLPIDAIAQDGVETYVFRVNGEHLVRQPVQVEFRDQLSAVIADDGSLYPGDQVALNAAHQLLVALKNKSGGGVDPHAGHNH